MAIRLLGGLTAQDFLSGEDQIQLHIALHGAGHIDGYQLLVGHPFWNGIETGQLLERVTGLGIPYLVHGPAERVGVDFGRARDPHGVFREFRKKHPDVEWQSFNQESVETASRIASGNNSLDERIVLHPGWAPREEARLPFGHIQGALRDIGVPYLLETIPGRAYSGREATHIGFGSDAMEMQWLLSKSPSDPGRVVMDLSNVLSTAHQESLGSRTSVHDRYETLLDAFLRFSPSRFVHFSGVHTCRGMYHGGFLGAEGRDAHLQRIAKNTLRKLRWLHRDTDVYVALEMPFVDLDQSLREIAAFEQTYT